MGESPASHAADALASFDHCASLLVGVALIVHAWVLVVCGFKEEGSRQSLQ